MDLPTKPLATTQQACCCSAKPMVVAVMSSATSPSGDAVDLLLCGHHYRISRDALDAAGAVVFDADGRILVPAVWEPKAAGVPVALL